MYPVTSHPSPRCPSSNASYPQDAPPWPRPFPSSPREPLSPFYYPQPLNAINHNDLSIVVRFQRSTLYHYRDGATLATFTRKGDDHSRASSTPSSPSPLPDQGGHIKTREKGGKGRRENESLLSFSLLAENGMDGLAIYTLACTLSEVTEVELSRVKN